MAFHDETTAQRLLSLIALQLSYWPEGAPRVMRDMIDQSRSLLLQDDFYAGANNHGMYQDLALLVYAAVSSTQVEERRHVAAMGARRLREYGRSAFTSEGVHIEHSPSYHLLVVRSLLIARALVEHLVEDGILEAAFDDIDDILEGAEFYATHMIGPDGMFPPVSDTARRKLDTTSNYLAFKSDEFRFAASCGGTGIQPTARTAVFPESGVAVYRSAWGDPLGTFLHFSASYNGGYHKHADEMSVYVAAGGHALLREAGPYGYNYQDPLTKYAFSSFAHNGLVVDGNTLPRHDGRFDETYLEDLGSTSAELSVRGTTTRHDGVNFSRDVVASGGETSSVITLRDTLQSKDSHRYQLLWHLGPNVRPVVRGDHVELFVDRQKLGELFFDSSVPYRLRVICPSSDDVLGWTFLDFGVRRRAYTLEIEMFEENASIDTTIKTGEFSLVDRGVDLLADDSEWRAFGVPELRYLLEPPPSGESDRLIVIFSAIAPERDFTFNYRRSITNVDAWKLFILDDWGVRGAYYYSRHRDAGIFASVQALITKIATEKAVLRDSVVTIGSSKGGAGALIHGLAFGAGRVVAGAPQTRIGHFTSRAHPEVLRYMAGGAGPSDAAWADHIIFDRLRNAGRTVITILVGDGDHHLRDHALPLVEAAKDSLADVQLVTLPGTPHSEIGRRYAAALPRILNSVFTDTARVGYLVQTGPGAVSLKVELRSEERVVVKWFHGAHNFRTESLSTSTDFAMASLSPGRYRARIYVRTADGESVPPFTTPYITI